VGHVSCSLSLLIYKAVYIPRILYGAKIWYPSTATADIKRKMESTQRRALLAITGAYKTTSTRALQVLAGTPPIFLRIEAAIRIQNGMSKTDSETILTNQWQALWDGSTKGRWAHGFMPNIKSRLYIPLTFDHYTSQMVTGHGDFNGKLYNFKLVDSPQCSCGHVNETAEHVLYECPTFEALRQRLKDATRANGSEWPCERKIFATSRAKWSTFEKFAKDALITKERKRLEESIRLREEAERDDN